MTRIYETPGVYFERTDASLAGIPGLRTDIAGFVGIAERGPRNIPVPIESWRQFEAYFGGFIGSGFLAYAVRAFFENGGRRCWVVRVTSDASASAEVELQAVISPGGTTESAWRRIEAISPGVWGDELEVTFQETHGAQSKTVPAPSLACDAVVEMIAGFAPRDLARLTQPGATTAYRIIQAVDANRSRVSWADAVTGFDPTKPIHVESVEYTLLVRRAGRLVRTYEGLSLVPGHARFGPDLLPPLAETLKRKRPGVLPAAPEPIAIIGPEPGHAIDPIHPLDLSPFQNTAGGGRFVCSLRGGADGLVTLRTSDFTGEVAAPEDSDELRSYKERGITALNTVDEVALVAVPDIHIRPIQIPLVAPIPPCVPDPCLPVSVQPPIVSPKKPVGDTPPTFLDEEVFAVQRHLVEQCEKLRDRFAVLDPPYSAAKNDKLGTAAIRRWRNRFDSTYAALYYPWLKVIDPLRNAQSPVREVPPSGHVAGAMARGDLAVGVHKAPANGELIWAEALTAEVNAAEHGLLNSSGVNALRVFPGRGIRVFGARTVSSDPDWRFINVRRLLIMIEEAIDEALQWVVFEPNDHVTRTKVTLALRSFLSSLWRQGALMGATQEDAFFVKCNEVNNPPAERGNGRLLAEVGVAASQPFEFVVLRVGRVDNALEIAEAGIVGGQG